MGQSLPGDGPGLFERTRARIEGCHKRLTVYTANEDGEAGAVATRATFETTKAPDAPGVDDSGYAPGLIDATSRATAKRLTA